MTTNPTIDGVPRSTIELAIGDDGLAKAAAIHELRALLDAPAVERKPFGWFRTPKDCPLQGMFLHYDPEHGERDIQNALDFGFTVKRLYETPAAQPQGEPVALTNAQRRAADYKEQQAFNDWAWKKEGEAIGRMDGQAAAIEAWHARANLAEQPAPVAVMLPEFESAFEKWWEEDGQYCRAGGGSYEKTFAYRAYEAALSDVTRLNTK